MNKNQIYAVVNNGVVVNIAVWDGESEWKPTDGIAVLAEDGVGIGWLYDGEKFIKPEDKTAQ
ncbi:hypothetical protein GVI60_13270 [Citrobacter freundii]|uniref:hypothetical protein n=1 Tax=Citrobacter portucalensis TaxID=1639133 RepID=UPI001F456584|nr:hypothetical protein [Citrobacter portucalensis]UKK33070.1 hypothetical protein GVI60_13270 [Citrobacter freundii]